MRRAPSTPPELPGYRFQRPLGSGGFADVFLYEQRLPRRNVAVKVLLTEELGRDTRAQFVAEANLMAQLSAHPYIVTIFHADVAADGRPYFVMEYCSGPSLAERYKRERFSVEDALRTGIRLSGAVATAHAAGILHRDIKPANVLTNDYGWPALTDFGISSNLEGEIPVHTMTVTGPFDSGGTGGTGQSAIGMSVPWSPPEMFDDDPRPDAGSDVFSLAATVHTLLAGRSPFEVPGRPNGTLDLMGRIERGAITPIDRDDVPASLVAVLRRGMAVRRDDRYRSAVELGRALQRIELELGYASTSIDVPNLAPGGRSPGSEAPADDVDVDATRARTVQTVAAQPAAPVAPDADETRARSVTRVDAQPLAPVGAAVADGTVLRTARPVEPDADEHTVIRPRAVPTAPAPAPARPAPGAPETAEPAEPARKPGRLAAIIGGAAGLVVVAVVVLAIVLTGEAGGAVAPTNPPTTPQDAIANATVPTPEVSAGERGADGSVVFAVSHERAEDGDVYRWRLADGSGTARVAEGDEIVVDEVQPGANVCVLVAVQRGGKLSEEARACTS